MNDKLGMGSPKPYIIRAFYDWVEGNHCTPFMAIDATVQGVSVPPSLAHEVQVVFDLSADTAVGLALGDRVIEFKARFSGVLHHVRIPPVAVLGVYAKENGSGVLFLEDGSLSIIGVELDAMTDGTKDMSAMASKPKLKVVAINPKKQAPGGGDNHVDGT